MRGPSDRSAHSACLHPRFHSGANPALRLAQDGRLDAPFGRPTAPLQRRYLLALPRRHLRRLRPGGARLPEVRGHFESAACIAHGTSACTRPMRKEKGDGPASSTATRELLGWALAGTGLQEDLDRPEYLTGRSLTSVAHPHATMPSPRHALRWSAAPRAGGTVRPSMLQHAELDREALADEHGVRAGHLARRSAGRCDRSCWTECPQPWVTVQTVRTAKRASVEGRRGTGGTAGESLPQATRSHCNASRPDPAAVRPHACRSRREVRRGARRSPVPEPGRELCGGVSLRPWRNGTVSAGVPPRQPDRKSTGRAGQEWDGSGETGVYTA
ncbi:hypothetical protein STANM337S_07125 [Streptomyces tanashiensis]